MEIQETIQGTTRMNPDDHDLLYHSSKLHPQLQPFFKAEMIRSLNNAHRAYFVTRANLAFDDGMSEGMRRLICGVRAKQFLLWLTRQSLHMDVDCGYCVFLDEIYDALDKFLSVPLSLKTCVVKTT